MSRVEVAIECDTDIAGELAAELTGASGEEVDTTELKSLDGFSAILQVVQIGITSLAVILPIITAYVGRKKVKKIKLGELEIENPTPEQVEHLWAMYVATNGHGAANRT